MADDFPPGCTCERINVDTSADVPGTKFIRGHSDPPCKVHLPSERALWDAGRRDAIPTREAVRALFDGQNVCGIWLENLLEDYEMNRITDAVMALLDATRRG